MAAIDRPGAIRAKAVTDPACTACAQPLRWLLPALWLLNLVDLLLTREALARGVAVEANRVVGYFIDVGPLAAVAFKIGVVTFGVVVLWRLRRHRITLVGTALITGVYALIVVYEAVYLTYLV